MNLPILPSEVAKPNYSLAMALKDERVRQWRMSRHPVHDDGVMSPAKWKQRCLAKKQPQVEAPAPIPMPLYIPGLQATNVIRAIVAPHFNTTPTEIMSKRRYGDVTMGRHVAMHLSRQHTHLSLPQIAYYFGGFDHSSCLHAVNRIQRMRDTYPAFDAKIQAIGNDVLKALGRSPQ